MQFEISATDHAARAGTFRLGSSEVQTPVFMPVGTQATVKAISQEDLDAIGYRLILGNTYHLYLRPGAELIDQMGGLKKYMSWPHAALTDSGGYQAFSLSANTKLVDEGVIFRSHLDGSQHLFSPERVIDIQRKIGADIIMPIDDCAAFPADEKRLRASLERTDRWLKECKAAWESNKGNSNLFAICQGGTSEAFRAESAARCAQIDLPGYAIGGLSVGEPLELFAPSLSAAIAHLPHDKPRYVMGVGSIPELLAGVELGVDMFDCVLPTRNARNGQVFTSAGKLNLRKQENADKDIPIDANCSCRVCRRYSLGYIRHLHKQKEILGLMLSTYHNLHFMFHFMREMRESIIAGRFREYKIKWLGLFNS